MRVDPIKPTVKPNGTKRLKLKCDILLSNFALNFNLRRYSPVSVNLSAANLSSIEVRRCRLSVSKHELKAPMVSAPEAKI